MRGQESARPEGAAHPFEDDYIEIPFAHSATATGMYARWLAPRPGPDMPGGRGLGKSNVLIPGRLGVLRPCGASAKRETVAHRAVHEGKLVVRRIGGFAHVSIPRISERATALLSVVRASVEPTRVDDLPEATGMLIQYVLASISELELAGLCWRGCGVVGCVTPLSAPGP